MMCCKPSAYQKDKLAYFFGNALGLHYLCTLKNQLLLEDG